MKLLKIFSVVLLVSAGSFYYYYTYIDTLMLSEIIGKSQNSVLTMAINLFDFDTGLTRHDINHISSTKDYWIKRINEVEAINDMEERSKANEKLLAEMLDDPTMKKVCKGLLIKGTDLTKALLGAL